MALKKLPVPLRTHRQRRVHAKTAPLLVISDIDLSVNNPQWILCCIKVSATLLHFAQKPCVFSRHGATFKHLLWKKYYVLGCSWILIEQRYRCLYRTLALLYIQVSSHYHSVCPLTSSWGWKIGAGGWLFSFKESQPPYTWRNSGLRIKLWYILKNT